MTNVESIDSQLNFLQNDVNRDSLSQTVFELNAYVSGMIIKFYHRTGK